MPAHDNNIICRLHMLERMTTLQHHVMRPAGGARQRGKGSIYMICATEGIIETRARSLRVKWSLTRLNIVNDGAGTNRKWMRGRGPPRACAIAHS